MAGSSGKNCTVFGNGYELTALLNQCETTGEIAMSPNEQFGDSWHAYKPGPMSGSMTFGGLFSDGSNEIAELAENALGGADKIYIHCPEGSANGKDFLGMVGTMTKDAMSSPRDGMVDISCEVQSNVGVDIGRISSDESTAQTTNGNNDSAVIDHGAATSAGVAGYCVITAASGTVTSIKIQDSSDNVSFADYITFTIVAANTQERIVDTTACDRYVRTRIALGAASSINAFTGFARYAAA